MDLNIRIGGEAGQGLVSTGEILTGALSSTGLHVFTGKSYMSRIRGGLNWFDIRISDSELFALKKCSDLTVALSAEAMELLGEYATPDGIVVYNGDGEGKKRTLYLNFDEIAKEVSGSVIMANSVAAGAIFALLGYSPDSLFAYLQKEFREKGEDVIRKNLKCASKGYSEATRRSLKIESPVPGNASGEYTSGASAIALSAAVSGIKLVSAYPMTPGTATFSGLAALSDKYGIVVEQSEDEIAAVNMICGAVYAGVPAMTTTSGGGFALMCEGLSLAGMMELPIVIVIAQRPGPATGLPTRTGQEDLKFAINAGHGEFARAVFAPGTIQECYELTRKAIETAHEFQGPVIILTDQYLQDIQKNIGCLSEEYNPVKRHIVGSEDDNYKRYMLTPDGISPRAVPGGKSLVVCDSDEHAADGHLTEDLEIRNEMQRKRMSKMNVLKSRFVQPEYYGEPDAEQVFICWGSTYGPCREAVDRINATGRKTALLHYSQVWPLDILQVSKLLEKKVRLIVVEGNYTGQFLSLLKEHGIAGECDLITRYDGLPFTPEFIIGELEK